MKIPCSSCNQRLEIPEELAGQTIECPSCNASLAVPAIEAASPATPQVQATTPQPIERQKPAPKRKPVATPSVDSPKKSKSSIAKFAIAAVAVILAVGLIIFAMTGSPGAALKKAAREGNIVVVRRELANGVDVNARAENSPTALMFAAANGQKEIIEFLIKKGADVNLKVKIESSLVSPNKEIIKNYLTSNALFAAVDTGQTETAEMLISKGARVNAMITFQSPEMGTMNTTVLHYAVGRGDTETVKMLIEKGASINKLASQPRPGNKSSVIKFTPLDGAINAEDDELIELLRKHGGKTKTKF